MAQQNPPDIALVLIVDDDAEVLELGALRFELLLQVAKLALEFIGGRDGRLELDDGNLGGCGRGGRGCCLCGGAQGQARGKDCDYCGNTIH